jgi:hypothetical protein
VFVSILDSRVLWRLHGHIENYLNYKLILFINEAVIFLKSTNSGDSLLPKRVLSIPVTEAPVSRE